MASKRPHTDATGLTPALGTCAQLPDEIWLVIGRLCASEEMKETSRLRLVKRSLANELSQLLYKQAFKRILHQRQAVRAAETAADAANEAFLPIQRAHRQYPRIIMDHMETLMLDIYSNMCASLQHGLVKTPEAAGFVALLQLDQLSPGRSAGPGGQRWGNAEFKGDAGLTAGKIPLQLPDSA